MSASFWIAVGLLLALAASFVLVPVWRERRRGGRWPVAGLVCAALILPATAYLYWLVGGWRAGLPTAMPPVSEMAATLAARLREHPDDPTGWRLLGRSYLMLGQPAEARAALREAWSRTPSPDNELKLALAEAEALTDRAALGDEAGRLLEEVLAGEPDNPKALFYGGLAALEQQRPELARERWKRLLTLNPPPAVADILNQQLAALDGGQVSAPPGSNAAAAQTGPVIGERVRLGEDLPQAGVGEQSALFIIARAPEGGPPVAVLREPADALPGVFALSDAHAMIPGRTLGAFPSLRLVARLSLTGQPTAQPGDLYGERQYRPGVDPAEVELVIDKVQQ